MNDKVDHSAQVKKTLYRARHIGDVWQDESGKSTYLKWLDGSEVCLSKMDTSKLQLYANMASNDMQVCANCLSAVKRMQAARQQMAESLKARLPSKEPVPEQRTFSENNVVEK